MIFVKICGLTCLEDARCAVEAGADLLGFILYPKSPRYIPPAQIAPITAALRELAPEVVTVGVFVNETPQAMARALDEAGLDLAQLSGDETPDHLRALQGRAYKAVREAAHAAAWLSAGRSPEDRSQESGVRRRNTQYEIRNTKSRIGLSCCSTPTTPPCMAAVGCGPMNRWRRRSPGNAGCCWPAA